VLALAHALGIQVVAEGAARQLAPPMLASGPSWLTEGVCATLAARREPI
jgi:hypothetical protein